MGSMARLGSARRSDPAVPRRSFSYPGGPGFVGLASSVLSAGKGVAGVV